MNTVLDGHLHLADIFLDPIECNGLDTVWPMDSATHILTSLRKKRKGETNVKTTRVCLYWNTACLHEIVLIVFLQVVIVELCTQCIKSYSVEEQIFILEHYFTTKSDESVQDVFKRVFPGKQLPANSTICRLVAKFSVKGGCADLPKPCNLTVVTPRNRVRVAASVTENPRLSI